MLKFSRSTSFYFLIAIFIIPFLFYFNWLFHFQDSLWTYGDGEFSYLSYRHFMIDSWKNWHFPLWNPYINLGIPFHSDPQTETLYPFNLLYLLLPFNIAFNSLMMLHFVMGGLFMFAFCRIKNISNWTSFFAALAFMFCGAINTRRGHVSVEYTLVWIPIIFYAYEKLKKDHQYSSLALLSLLSALQFYAGFTQISFYTLLALAIYMLFSLPEYKDKKKWLKEGILFLVLFILLVAAQLVPALKTAVAVGREHVPFDIFTSYSLPFRNLTALLNPLYMGFEYPNSPYPLFSKMYSDAENLTEFSLYLGVLPFLFAIYSFTLKKERTFNYWYFLAIFSLLFSLGGNISFLYKIFYHIPVLNSFRVPARMLALFSFAMIVLFAKAFDQTVQQQEKTKIKYFMRLFLAAHIALTVYAVTSSRAHLFSPEILISSTIAFVFFVLFEYDIWRFYNRSTVFKVVLTSLILVDFWFFAFFNSNIYSKPPTESKLLEVINSLDPNDDYRILTIAGVGGELSFDLLGRDRNMIVKKRSLIGHTSFVPKVFMEALRCDEAGTFYDYDYFLRNFDLIQSLNVKWIIFNNTEPNNHRYQAIKNRLKLIKTFGQYDIFEFPQAQKLVFDLKKTMLTESNVIDGHNYREVGLVKNNEIAGDYSAKVQIDKIEKTNNDIQAKISTDNHTVLAISTTYTPEWKAFLNEKPIPLYKLNGLIMAVKLPPGDHVLNIEYQPTAFYFSCILSFIFFIIVLFFIISKHPREI